MFIKKSISLEYFAGRYFIYSLFNGFFDCMSKITSIEKIMLIWIEWVIAKLVEVGSKSTIHLLQGFI